MNEDLILLEKLQDILDDLDFIVESDIETSVRLKLMEVISELDQKVSTFEEWADEQGQIEEEKGIWSDFATEGLLIDKRGVRMIHKIEESLLYWSTQQRVY